MFYAKQYSYATIGPKVTFYVLWEYVIMYIKTHFSVL